MPIAQYARKDVCAFVVVSQNAKKYGNMFLSRDLMWQNERNIYFKDIRVRVLMTISINGKLNELAQFTLARLVISVSRSFRYTDYNGQCRTTFSLSFLALYHGLLYLGIC